MTDFDDYITGELEPEKEILYNINFAAVADHLEDIKRIR